METESQNISTVIIFFFYGLSFFVLGTAISLQSRKGSEFKFGAHLWLLATFGFLHGTKEWLEMFTMIGSREWTDATIELLTAGRFFLAMVSFVFLFMFGLDLVAPATMKKRVNWISICLFSFLAVCLTVVRCLPDTGKSLAPHVDLLVRYGFGFPAAGLTAWAFSRQKRSAEILRLDSASLQLSLTAAAVLFGVYAVLDGLVIKHESFFPAALLSYKNFEHVMGLPVQIFRAMCAGGIVYCMLRILTIFELEKKSRLENAYREIINISTREQERIGQDIHDGLCQELAGILLNGKIVEKQLEKQGSAEMAQVRKINGLVDQAISHSRAVSKSLYPVEIEEQGLVCALRDYADTVEDIYGIECRVRLDDDGAIIDHAVATHLFRIAQEAVVNAVRHGKAAVVTISLCQRSGDAMELSIVDNGSGISPTSGGSRGMGIKIMNYRARVIDGTLEIGRHPEGGTQVVCSFVRREKHGVQSPEPRA